MFAYCPDAQTGVIFYVADVSWAVERRSRVCVCVYENFALRSVDVASEICVHSVRLLYVCVACVT